MGYTNSPDELRKTRMAIVFVTLALVTLLHYTTMGSYVAYHTFYRELYFVPIILMSFWYGLRKGLYIAALVIFLYLPHVWMTWGAQPGVNVGNMLEVLVFLLVAVATGYLSDRERERSLEMTRAHDLATLGKVTLAMTSELREVLKGLKDLESSVPPFPDRDFSGNLRDVIEKISILNQTLSHFGPGQESRRGGLVEIAGAIERVRKTVGRMAKNSGTAVVAQLDSTPGLLQVNEEDLIWILEELVKNAIEHSAPGETITIRVNRFEDRYEVAVADQGRGIDPEDLPRIFVPFFTTRDKGTGLGLCICKKKMQDNGGDILVESEPGKGSTFTLVFPQAVM